MSIPVSLAGAAMGIPLSPIDSMLHLFNSNPYFIGLMMFILNVGGRFVGLEITKKQEQFFQHPWVRRGLIFAVIFMGTRNIWVSFWGTVVIVLIFGYLFNEHSALCLFGKGGLENSTCQQGESLTPEEREILQRLHAKSQRFVKKEESSELSEEDILQTDIYAANMALLRR